VDVLAPEGYGEIIGGSQRVSSYELLKRRIEEHKLPREAFEWYLDLRRYGSVPHSGFGMGIERAVAWICGLDHVRETIPFARTLHRIYPYRGEKLPPFDGNNNETFDNFTPAQWDDLVKKLNQVLTDWDKAVETADDQKLAQNASLIAHVGAHNAYHIGQILYVRKLEGAWDPAKGVK
jgi:hypothetical protein